MINIKLCRKEFLTILHKSYSINNLNSLNLILIKLKNLKKHIKNEYHFDNELPQICHTIIQNLMHDIENFENLLINLGISSYYTSSIITNEERYQLIDSIKMYEHKYLCTEKIHHIPNKYINVNNIIKPYEKFFNKTIIKKSLDEGLNILKNKKDIYFNKNTTKNSQEKLYLQYPELIIKKYFNISLISNLIFLTKNLDNIDTQKIIEKVELIKG